MGSAVEVSATRKRSSTALLGDWHYAYTITIKKGDAKAAFAFHDSIYNYMRNIGATENMIANAVDCIITDCYNYDDYPDMYEFGEEFGYDMYEEDEKKRVERIWKACKKTYDKLHAILSDDEIAELRALVEQQQVGSGI